MITKILQPNTLFKVRELNPQKSIIFVSGCFDILHFGHVQFLEEAASKADILVVGVLSDEFVKARKGNNRPIYGEQERLQLISHLDVVDYVFLLNMQNREKVLEDLKPNYYGVGGDRKEQELPEQKYLSKFNIEVLRLQYFESDSTSSILEKIQKSLT